MTKRVAIGLMWIGILSTACSPSAPSQETPQPSSTSGEEEADESPSQKLVQEKSGATAQEPSEVARDRRLLHADRVEGERVTVFHHANGSGSLKDCGCSTKPLGGLARRAQWLEGRKGKTGSTLLFDAGDSLTDGSPEELPGGSKHQAVQARAKLILQTYSIMNYTAYVPGDRDLLLGAPLLQMLAKEVDVPFLAANVKNTDGNSIFRRDTPVVEVSGARIALVGLVSNSTPNQEKLSAMGIHVSDPFSTLKTLLGGLEERADQVWVIGHLKNGEAEILLEEFPQVSLVLGGQDITRQERLSWVDGNATAQGGEKGKTLFMTTLVITDPKARYYDPTLEQALRSKLGVLETKIKERSATLAEGMKENEAGGSTNVDWLKKNVVKLKTEVATLKMDLEAASKGEDEAVNTVVFDPIDLTANLPESDRVATGVADLLLAYPLLKEK